MEPPLTAKRVFDAARAGDRKAMRVVRKEAGGIALAIAAVASVVDPELVILGGGIGGNGDLLLDHVADELQALSPFRPRVETSALREEATLYGSVYDGPAGSAGPALRRGESLRDRPTGGATYMRSEDGSERSRGGTRGREAHTMRRWLVATAALALVAAACTAGGGDEPAPTVDASASNEPVTVTLTGSGRRSVSATSGRTRSRTASSRI